MHVIKGTCVYICVCVYVCVRAFFKLKLTFLIKIYKNLQKRVDSLYQQFAKVVSGLHVHETTQGG